MCLLRYNKHSINEDEWLSLVHIKEIKALYLATKDYFVSNASISNGNCRFRLRHKKIFVSSNQIIIKRSFFHKDHFILKELLKLPNNQRSSLLKYAITSSFEIDIGDKEIIIGR